METPLYMGVCSTDRYQKAKDAFDKRGKKYPRKEPPICDVSVALQDDNLKKHFYKQRAMIGSYYQQARKAWRENNGDVVRDIKSLVVPYLFSLVGRKPELSVQPGEKGAGSTAATDFKQFSAEMSNANTYFINHITRNFQPTTKQYGKAKRIIPFKNQLDSWWCRNKAESLKQWMTYIHRNAESLYPEAASYEEGSHLKEKEKQFKEARKEAIHGAAPRRRGFRNNKNVKSNSSSSSSFSSTTSSHSNSNLPPAPDEEGEHEEVGKGNGGPPS